MMSSSLSPGAGSPKGELFNPNLTVGAIEVGVLVSAFLFGLVTVQSYIYIHRFPKDSLVLKLLVRFVWLLELGHTICICQALYIITVSQYGQPQSLDILPQSLNVSILFSGFIGPIEQGWFANRIYKFSGKKLLPLFCAILGIARLFLSVVLAAISFHRLTAEEYYKHWLWLLTTILVVGAVTDVILAAALCYYVSHWRGSAFERTSRLVYRIMLWSIESGLLTSVGAVALLVSFLVMRHNYVWVGIFSVLARLFSNSFLASLNSRPVLAQIYQEDVLRLTRGNSERSPTSPVSPYRQPIIELTSVRVAQPVPGITSKATSIARKNFIENEKPYDAEKGRGQSGLTEFGF